MRILGVDPGYGIVGFGVIEKKSGSEFSLIASGTIKTSPNDSFLTRLTEIADDLCLLCEKYKPDQCAVEELFFAKNTKTALKVAEARGVILYTLFKNCSEVHSYTPLQVKMALTGNGRAEKSDVLKMVSLTLKTTQKLGNDDAVDALAIAITHSQSNHLFKSI